MVAHFLTTRGDIQMLDIIKTKEAEEGFYPTPDDLAAKLLEGIDWKRIETVLEPSAGKGNLVYSAAKKYINSPYAGRIQVDCIEIDPYLRSILQWEFSEEHEDQVRSRFHVLGGWNSWNDKNLTATDRAEKRRVEAEYKMLQAVDVHIVHDDFLTFNSRKKYDLIVMNPPFANGDEHLLKAISLAEKNGGIVRCILNAQTILNPYTNRRKVLQAKLAEHGADIQFVDSAFSDGERKTDVSVAVIKMSIAEPKMQSDIFDRLSKAAQIDEATPPDIQDLTVTDFLSQIVTRFNVEVDAGIALIKEYEAMKPYILDSFDFEDKYKKPTLQLKVGKKDYPSINEFISLTRMKYWQALFSNKEFVGQLTTNLREKYRGMVNKLKDYDFTLFNIQQIVAEMNSEMNQGIQDTIVALFDKMTAKHSWYPETEKNIHYYNGWKTNKVHKINNKVILPVNGMFSDYSWSETFEVRNAESVITDIEKVFDYLDGNMTAAVDLHGALLSACKEGRTKNIQLKYFSVTLYKKGTMHIKFHNQELVDRFNIYCCAKKNWLPPNYGRTEYQNMTAEEKAVVDGFNGNGEEGSGEKAYKLVVEKQNYYLNDPAGNMPLIAAPAM